LNLVLIISMALFSVLFSSEYDDVKINIYDLHYISIGKISNQYFRSQSMTKYFIINKQQETENTEKWYTSWSIGTSLTDNICHEIYSEDICVQSSTNKTTIEILGFYWHIKPKALGGFVISGIGDEGKLARTSLTLSALSFIQYIDKFGSGLYYRIDAGYAESIINSDVYNELKNGFGILIGVGYSFDYTHTRLLLGLNYTISSIESREYSYTNFMISGLF